jgi:dihydroflavonol-4-reductase
MPFVLDGGHDFVDVRDVAEGMLLAAERGRSGEAYLLGGGRMTLTELARCCGGRVPPVLPAPLAKLLAAPAPLYERLTGRRALLTPYALHAVSVSFRVRCEKAARELGFRARPLEESVGDALAWFGQRGEATAVPGPGRTFAGVRA